ncbi:MAG: Asp-tRNA(Asn)/Glu-tRNA(Gln) amidotransferase subunit GatC [Patescibacteria group bacterium]
MTKISTDTVKVISKLAKLKLTEEQINKFALDLSSIVGQMEEIKNLDVKNIAETARVIDEENILREDIITPSFNQEQALKNSKSIHNGYFLVPQILKDD